MEKKLEKKLETEEMNIYTKWWFDMRNIMAKENKLANNCNIENVTELIRCRINLLKNRTNNMQFDFTDFSTENLECIFLQKIEDWEAKIIKKTCIEDSWTLEKMYAVVKRDCRNVLQLTTIKFKDFTNTSNREYLM